MLSNITGSPRTSLVGVLVFLFGAASAVGRFEGLSPNVAAACAAVVGLLLGLFGVDPSKLLPSAKSPGALPSSSGGRA